MKPRYRVLTWDHEKQQFTPQRGVGRASNITLWQVRGVLRRLQEMGYEVRKGDPKVRVETINESD